MKINCKYSGVVFEVREFGNFGKRHSLIGVHPIFDLPNEILLHQLPQWAAGNLDVTERKLLFVALLASMKDSKGEYLIHFKHPALPADGIVQNYMERLFKWVAWYTDVRNPQLQVPYFKITKENSDLTNVKVWLDCWEEAKAEFERGSAANYQARKLRAKQDAVEKVLTHATKSKSDYRVIAKWAMEAAAVPMMLRETWTKLFLLEGFDVLTADTIQLRRMLTHFEHNLDALEQHKFAYAVLSRVRFLAEKNQKGIAFGIGAITNEDGTAIDFLAAEKDSFKFVEDEIETKNKAITISSAPRQEPKQKDYPNLPSYLKAKAAYFLWKKQNQEELAAKEEANKQLAFSLTSEEEVAAEVIDDENQIIQEILNA